MEISIDENTSFENYAYSIEVLQNSTKTLLSRFLNPRYCLLNDEGIARDWEGLIHLIGDPEPCLYKIKQSCDQTNELLNIWLSNCKQGATIDRLLEHLKKMDRYDVLEDILHHIDRDINLYKIKITRIEESKPNFEILTVRDSLRMSQGLGPEYYDAFILFGNSDLEFVEELVETLEGKYNLKLCVKDRDLEAGVLEHESVLKLIADRCNKLIVVMSTDLFEEPVNMFFCNFGIKMGMEKNDNKLIGCIYKECSIPRDFNLYFMLDKERISKFANFWEKLRDSIRPLESNEIQLKTPYHRNINKRKEQLPNLNRTNTIMKLFRGKKKEGGETNEADKLPSKEKKIIGAFFKKNKNKVAAIDATLKEESTEEVPKVSSKKNKNIFKKSKSKAAAVTS